MALKDTENTHLEKLKKCLDANYEIKIYKNSVGFKLSSGEQPYECRLYICNKYFASNLYENYGMVPNRSNIDLLINKIPYDFYKDFIRGILDAEGSLGHSYINDRSQKNKSLKFRIQFTTYEKILDFIQGYLLSEGLLLTRQKLSVRHEGRDMFAKRLHICGNDQIMKILNHLYSDATIYLDRKYEKYLELIPLYNNKKRKNQIEQAV